MVLKVLKKSSDNVQTTVEWSSAFYNYLKEVLRNLEALQADPQSRSAKQYYKNASQNFRQVRRSERRINRYYGRVKTELEELGKILPEALKKEMAGLQAKLRPFEAAIINEASFYRGEMNDGFEEIGVGIALLNKKDNSKSVNYQSLFASKMSKFVNEVKNLLGEKATGSALGIVPFIAALRELQAFLKKLEKMSS